MNRRQAIIGSVIGLSAIPAALLLFNRYADNGGIKGIVWQVDNASVDIAGDWQKLGVSELLVQWSVVDDEAFIPGTGLVSAARMPDWARISRQPWAKTIIMGLAGRFKEPEARQQVDRLGELSEAIARMPMPVPVSGWYFPVEIDPTWQDAPKMAAILSRLPQPLWVSVYDSANVGAVPLADWLAGWLPGNVGVFFQDGTGVHAREPSVARDYADALAGALGRDRLRIIIEAFRPSEAGGFRPATTQELIPQILAMKGYDLFLYDGPHHLNSSLVDGLASSLKI